MKRVKIIKSRSLTWPPQRLLTFLSVEQRNTVSEIWNVQARTLTSTVPSHIFEIFVFSINYWECCWSLSLSKSNCSQPFITGLDLPVPTLSIKYYVYLLMAANWSGALHTTQCFQTHKGGNQQTQRLYSPTIMTFDILKCWTKKQSLRNMKCWSKNCYEYCTISYFWDFRFFD